MCVTLRLAEKESEGFNLENQFMLSWGPATLTQQHFSLKGAVCKITLVRLQEKQM